MENSKQDFHLYILKFFFSSTEEVEELIEKWPLDYGCHPHLQKDEADVYSLMATATSELFEALQQNSKYKFEVINKTVIRKEVLENLVGKSDRFNGGKIIPRRLA